MPRWSDDGEDDGDDESDSADAEPTVPCPYCRHPVPEDAVRCPSCENYISKEDAPAGRKPWWILLGVAAGLLVMYFWIVGG